MIGHNIRVTSIEDNWHEAVCNDCEFRVQGPFGPAIFTMAVQHWEETQP